ncbi:MULTISPECIES: hypothetical protein [Methylobacteriaceae]|uniref:hypothetical protein n=1 Tax=Methylobacteriaceae TaxID=119045 RepID=UPI000CDA020E|nr:MULTISPECIES: hypothetical protein [Methylobacteriaceae]MCP1549437.1 hypothetical protein [Methylorubrum zatmanii]MCP1553950.1 hypothetical protein [Methylorubrum extorquens]MCP1579739.1 hypothetical protein [Methylorubrum extorquens]POR41005.1 hypothetical protein CRT23_21170 [Methylobacterium sp. V23]
MIGLALALVWTVPGIAALVSMGAAALAFAYLPRLAVPLICLAVILYGVAFVSRIRDEIDTARRDLATAKATVETQKLSIAALERTSAAAATRAKANAAARVRIGNAPASDDGPVAPVLGQTLQRFR